VRIIGLGSGPPCLLGLGLGLGSGLELGLGLGEDHRVGDWARARVRAR